VTEPSWPEAPWKVRLPEGSARVTPVERSGPPPELTVWTPPPVKSALARKVTPCPATAPVTVAGPAKMTGPALWTPPLTVTAAPPRVSVPPVVFVMSPVETRLPLPPLSVWSVPLRVAPEKASPSATASPPRVKSPWTERAPPTLAAPPMRRRPRPSG
jgi:hypothetical protein